MSYECTTFNVMIASPGDVSVQRAIVREEVYGWNAIHSMHRKVVLLPVGWESHSSPEMGDRPQSIINTQMLNDCDLLVAIFATRLGTETGKHESGTVEEIKEHIAVEKPAMLYFSTDLGNTANFDVDQFKRLQEFQTWCRDRGLYETYDSDNVFRHKFGHQLQLKLNQHPIFKGVGVEATQLSPLRLDIITSSRSQSNRDESLEDLTSANTSSLHPHLTKKAIVMLKAAALDPSGYVLAVSTMEGTYYQVNNERLNTTSDRREIAEWDEAAEQLVGAKLIRQKNTANAGLRLYEIALSGYRVADLIDGTTMNWIM